MSPIWALPANCSKMSIAIPKTKSPAADAMIFIRPLFLLLILRLPAARSAAHHRGPLHGLRGRTIHSLRICTRESFLKILRNVLLALLFWRTGSPFLPVVDSPLTRSEGASYLPCYSLAPAGRPSGAELSALLVRRQIRTWTT